MDNIRQIRIDKGMSQGTLAGLTGVTVSTISLVERGIIEPSSGLLRRICQALELEELTATLDGLLAPAPRTPPGRSALRNH